MPLQRRGVCFNSMRKFFVPIVALIFIFNPAIHARGQKTSDEEKAITTLLISHLNRYPRMEIQDVYKLLHQSALGSGHAVSNEATARVWLENEATNLKAGKMESRVDPITPDKKLARIHLRAFLENSTDLEGLNRAFVQTANNFRGSKETLKRYLNYALRLAKKNVYPFTWAEMKKFFDEKAKENFPSVRHSKNYEMFYSPAYRVVALDYLSDKLKEKEYVNAKEYSLKDYYQLADGNEWHYTAPPIWRGDYISQIKAAPDIKLNKETPKGLPEQFTGFRHLDATKAAKALVYLPDEGIFYARQEFADGDSYAEFDAPVFFLPDKLRVGQKVEADRYFTRIYKNGNTARGRFKLKQTVTVVEDATVKAGTFKECLRIESEIYWELGDGQKMRSINTHHYAPNIGVVKTSSRFFSINEDGKETANRLIETELKSTNLIVK